MPNESIDGQAGQVRETLRASATTVTNRQKLQSLEELWRRVDSAPRDPRLRLRIGDVLRQLGRTDEAVEQYKEAFFFFLRKGFEKQAKAARAMILRLRPDDRTIHRSLEFPNDLALARTQTPLERELRGDAGVEPVGMPESSALKYGHISEALEKMALLPATLPETISESLETPEIPGSNLILLPSWGKGIVDSPSGEGIVVTVEAEGDAPSSRGKPRDRRVDPRIDIAEGSVRIWRGETVIAGRLEDLSSTGMFISCPRTFRVGSVVDLAVQLPGIDWIGTARARITRSVDATRKNPAGLGIAFLWADSPTEHWIEETVTAAFGHIPPEAPEVPSEPSQEDVRRAFPRAGVFFPAVIGSPEFEVTGWARDLSLGGAFIESPRVFGSGRRVEARLWLPGEPVVASLSAVIAHDVRPSEKHRGGVGIRFLSVSDALTARIQAAIATGALIEPVV